MTCTRCGGSGFLNLEQLPAELLAAFDEVGDHAAVLTWIAAEPTPHDVSVCDCCGDGDGWYGVPGEHYGPNDPRGDRGPYAYNGGLCECH